MKPGTLLLLGIGAYFLYQYMHHPPSPSMLPPTTGGGGGLPGSGSASDSIWTGIRWINCSDPGADPTMCAQLANPT